MPNASLIIIENHERLGLAQLHNIGISLIQVGLTSIGEGFAALNDDTFGAPKNLMLAGAVLLMFMVTSIENIGDITATRTCRNSRCPSLSTCNA